MIGTGMRVLLVKPKARLRTILGLEAFQRLEPIELGYIAAVVRDPHTARVLDLRLARRPVRAFRDCLHRFRPNVVGFTSYTHEASLVKQLAHLTRDCLPDAFVVVGGHHATVAPSDFNTPEIDAIVRGEGCGPFSKILSSLEKGEPPDDIPDVVLTGDRYNLQAAAVWPRFPDPATLPKPRRDLWEARRYRSVWACEEMKAWQRLFPPVSLVRASWGCRMKCSFCVIPYLCGGEHRPRPAGWVADEIAQTPTEHIYFCDDENFIDEDFAWELADAIAGLGIQKRYFAWTRATTVNRSPELFKRWREIGLDSAFLGFESANDAQLKRYKKGGSVIHNERALDTLRELGVAVHAAFMIHPEYTETDFQTLREYVDRLPPAQSSFTVCTPSPGTPDYREAQARIWIDNPFDLHDCMHPMTPTELPLRRFATLFAEQAVAGVRRTPLRQHHHSLIPADLWKVWRAEGMYRRGFEKLYEDYPHNLWD
jgi:radical SAM superfamily enzyme YgiQ (UPF0313 family)